MLDRMAERPGTVSPQKGFMSRGSIVESLAEKQRKIEEVRVRLHLLVEQKCGNFADREVGELSSYLDRLIVEYELSCALQQRAK